MNFWSDSLAMAVAITGGVMLIWPIFKIRPEWTVAIKYVFPAASMIAVGLKLLGVY